MVIPKFVSYYFRAGADKERSFKGVSPLHCALMLQRIPLINLLIRSGASIETPYKNQSPLHMAIDGGITDAVALLLQFGAIQKRSAHNGRLCMMQLKRVSPLSLLCFCNLKQIRKGFVMKKHRCIWQLSSAIARLLICSWDGMRT